jgi:hypothetical protein
VLADKSFPRIDENNWGVLRCSGIQKEFVPGDLIFIYSFYVPLAT